VNEANGATLECSTLRTNAVWQFEHVNMPEDRTGTAETFLILSPRIIVNNIT
jgi:hypothetical protein